MYTPKYCFFLLHRKLTYYIFNYLFHDTFLCFSTTNEIFYHFLSALLVRLFLFLVPSSISSSRPQYEFYCLGEQSLISVVYGCVDLIIVLLNVAMLTGDANFSCTR